MRNSDESAIAAPKIEQATAAMLDALKAAGVENDVSACLAAIGAMVGCIAASCGDPREAMRAVNAIANGIIDGSLLDP